MKYFKKAVSILMDFFFFLLLIIGAGLLILRAVGYQALAVQTGSMKNVYPVGSVVIVDNSSPDDIALGDVISFVADGHMTIVTHRVIDIDTVNQCFYTKGDENNVTDTNPVVYENLLGKVVFSAPYAGRLLTFSHSRIGRAVFFLVIAAIVLYFAAQLVIYIIKRRKGC